MNYETRSHKANYETRRTKREVEGRKVKWEVTFSRIADRGSRITNPVFHMKTTSFLTILLMIASCITISLETQGQYYLSQRYLTRGADTAEIYLNCLMHYDQNDTPWIGLFHSMDNGETLTLKKKTPLDMVEYGYIFGDSIAGRLFQLPMGLVSGSPVGISYDYGVTYEFKEFTGIDYTAAGCMAGEIYIQKVVLPFGLYRSDDYGNSFYLQSYAGDSLRLRDVGTLPGEVYGINGYLSHGPLALTYSNDYGQTFTTSFLEFPETPIFDEAMIYRGTEPGEIFFVIVIVNGGGAFLYHTFDYGQTITYQSELPGPGGEDLYTAGRTPGSFYVTNRIEFFSFSLLYIYFSRDYGLTFTEYFHFLDSTYTQIPRQSDPTNVLYCYPNPAIDYLQIQLSANEEVSEITFYTLEGEEILPTTIPPFQTSARIDVSTLPSGIYLVKVMQNNRMVGVGKVVIR